ncbi:hypothetical protein QZH41_014130 [Actinostola sp. cb2023]|nr:hypothetical protein QZH41_014130 [Actinostola sp. cb2023]
MESFKNRYLRICRDIQVFPLECVISQISKDFIEECTTLDLSSYNLTPEDCHALATALSDDLFFKELCFTDCLLSEDSCKLVLLGLMQNRSITSLNLKGNNIRCGGAEVLGQFLKRNTSVHSLRLEWNSLGLWDSGIGAIAEGIAVNQVLAIVDLRNNQITHEGAALLAAALKRNQTLKGLDLRWNNIGILGGREILSAFKYNKSLTCMELTGNNIPQDILKAVSLAAKQNFDQQSLGEEHRRRTEMMARELEKAENIKVKEVLSLKDEIDKERIKHEQYYDTTQEMIKQLNGTLSERKHTFDTLSAKLSATEAEVLLAEQKYSNLDRLCGNLKSELHSEREQRTNAELQHHKELNKVLEKNIELEGSIIAMERKSKALEMTIRSLEGEIDKVSADFTLKSKESDQMFQSELHNTKQRLEQEVQNLHHKMSTNSQSSQEKLQKIEEQRHLMEGEVSSLRSENIKIKLEADEQLMNAKAKLKQEELMRSQQYEERIGLIQASRDDLQLQSTKQLSQISEMQSQLSSITRESESQKRQIDTLKHQMQQKDSEYRQEISHLKLELDVAKRDIAEQRSTVSNLEDRLTEASKKHREAINQKDKEILFVNDQLRSKENELKKHQDEELKRAEMLEKAMYSFVSNTRTGSH